MINKKSIYSSIYNTISNKLISNLVDSTKIKQVVTNFIKQRSNKEIKPSKITTNHLSGVFNIHDETSGFGKFLTNVTEKIYKNLEKTGKISKILTISKHQKFDPTKLITFDLKKRDVEKLLLKEAIRPKSIRDRLLIPSQKNITSIIKYKLNKIDPIKSIYKNNKTKGFVKLNIIGIDKDILQKIAGLLRYVNFRQNNPLNREYVYNGQTIEINNNHDIYVLDKLSNILEEYEYVYKNTLADKSDKMYLTKLLNQIRDAKYHDYNYDYIKIAKTFTGKK